MDIFAIRKPNENCNLKNRANGHTLKQQWELKYFEHWKFRLRPRDHHHHHHHHLMDSCVASEASTAAGHTTRRRLCSFPMVATHCSLIFCFCFMGLFSIVEEYKKCFDQCIRVLRPDVGITATT